MKALVTGATGFIGGHVARALIARGFQVRGLARAGSPTDHLRPLDIEWVPGDLRDTDALKRAVAGCQILFHVAASYVFWTPDPKSVHETNVRGTRNMLEAARRAGVEKIVYTSTESTIGIRGRTLGNETQTSDLRNLAGHYKMSKLLAERLVLEFCDEGMPITIVNPTMPLGPGDIKPTPTGQVIVDFLAGRMPAYVNTGLNVVDVRDVAIGHLQALEHGRQGERYILGNTNLTLRDLLRSLETVTGIAAPTVRIPLPLALCAGYVDEFVRGTLLKRPPRIPLAAVKTARKFRHFDCSKAITELGFPQTPIEHALRDAVSWFTEGGYVEAKRHRPASA